MLQPAQATLLVGAGRWLPQDPLGFEAGDYNLYRYVGNNATNATDPSGEVAPPPRHEIPAQVYAGLLLAWRHSSVPQDQVILATASQATGLMACGNALLGLAGVPLLARPLPARREVGGLIVRDGKGQIAVRLGSPSEMGVGLLGPENFPATKPGETVIGSFHTHPFTMGAYMGGSFSVLDIMSALSGVHGNTSYVISRNYIYGFVVNDTVRGQGFAPSGNPMNRKIFLNNLFFLTQLYNLKVKGNLSDESTHQAVLAIVKALGFDVTYFRIRRGPAEKEPITRSGLGFLADLDAHGLPW
jgi:hypothetical protein